MRILTLGVTCALQGYLIWPAQAEAHAFGSRFDLPLPLSLYLLGSGGAIVLSFVITALILKNSHTSLSPWHVDLFRFRLARIFLRPAVSAALQALSVGLFVLVLCTGFFGINDTLSNFSPTFVWIIWWIAFAYIAALIGDFWPVINPWRILFDLTVKLTRGLGKRSNLNFRRTYPPWLGVWPATTLFVIFAWFELIYDTAKLPRSLAIFIVAYSVLTWLGMVVFGRDQWLSKGEAFSIVFRVFGRFAPIGKTVGKSLNYKGSQWQLRPYASDLITDKPSDLSMTVFILTLLSSVTFDGFKETPQWTAILQWSVSEPSMYEIRLLLNDFGLDFFDVFSTVMLLLFPLAFFLVYMLTCCVIQETSGSKFNYQHNAGLFVYSLVPIAIAYHLAHYLSYLLLSGQLIIPLISDPFGFGWNLFGTANYTKNLTIISTKFVWYTAVAAIVAGHVLAVIVAHITAIRAYQTKQMALRSQYPLLVLMVGYTMLSLWIFSQPILESPSYQAFREPSGFISLEPGSSGETCLDMRAHETIKFSFNSSRPVKFDIHFHDGFQVQFPIQFDDLLNYEGSFVATGDQIYCLWWSNPDTLNSQLTYEVTRP